MRKPVVRIMNVSTNCECRNLYISCQPCKDGVNEIINSSPSIATNHVE